MAKAPILPKLINGGKRIMNAAKNPAVIKTTLSVAAGAAAGYALYKASQKTPYKSPYQNLQFPNDLVDENSSRSYYMNITFSEYKRRSIFDRVFLSSTDGIRLPIPNNLIDTQSVTYGEEGASSAVGAGIEGALQGGMGAGGDFAGAAANIIGGMASGAVLDAAKAAAGDKIPVDQLLQMGGVAQNPFLTVLFKSPTFKQHSFSWKLTATTPEESNTIRDIIKVFRGNMLPGKTGAPGGTLLSYPNIANIQLFPNDTFLYKFKPCVIESMSVNFAPANTPSFFKSTNAPVEVQISLQLKEIEYWLNEDVV